MAASMPAGSEQQAPSRRVPIAVLILLTVIVGGWSFWRIYEDYRRDSSALPNPQLHAGVGEPLAVLELQPLTGGGSPVSLADLEEQVVLLNFWGTWCPPCRAELPHMAELRERFAGQRAFQLISVSYPYGPQEDRQSLAEETEDLLKRLKVELPTYYDPGNRTYAAMQHLLGMKQSAFPLSVLVDQQGLIKAVWVGYRPGLESEMERYIDDALIETE